MQIENYKKQYFEIYSNRLKTIKPWIKNRTDLEMHSSITELRNNTSFVIVGVLFIVTGTKPSIFDELENNYAYKPTNSYYSKNMKYFVEDNSGKVEIFFTKEILEKNILTSGAILGFVSEMKDDTLFVKEIIFPEEKEPISCKKIFNKKVALICNAKVDKDPERFQLAIDSINGTIGEKLDVLILVGCFFANKSNITPESIKSLQEKIKRSKVEVYVIPEIGDPVSNLIPYSSLKNVLGGSSEFLTNPCLLDNALFLPKESISDILKYKETNSEVLNSKFSDFRSKRVFNETEIVFTDEDRISAMEYSIKTRISCPSAPDTLKCVPSDFKSIFILNETPKIIFSSGEEFLEKKIGNKTFIVLPNFDESKKFVVFNLNKESETFEIDAKFN